MSGAMIGMEVTPRAMRRTQQDLRQVRTACCAAAAGTTSPATAARRTVAAALPATATASSDSVSRGLRSSLYPLLIPWNQLLFYLCHFTLYRANAPQFLRNLNIGIFLRHVKQACFMRGKRAVANSIARHHDSKVVVCLNKTRMGA